MLHPGLYRPKWHVLLSNALVMSGLGLQPGIMSGSGALLQPEFVLMSVATVDMMVMQIPGVWVIDSTTAMVCVEVHGPCRHQEPQRDSGSGLQPLALLESGIHAAVNG